MLFSRIFVPYFCIIRFGDLGMTVDEKDSNDNIVVKWLMRSEYAIEKDS